MAKFLDKAGLQIVWDQIKAKFIDNDELAAFLANYEKIEDLERDYADRVELAEILSGYATDTELANAIAGLANVYVKKEVNSTTGKALIFNEADGGGAKFENVDGTASFAGVNNDTNGGIGAQLYDINVASNKGSKLDVTKNGIYYTTGDTSALPAAQRDVVDNELVVKKDIKDIAGGMHFIGSIVPEAGESLEQTIARLYATKGKSYADRKPGDIVIINTPGLSQEYICDSEKIWVELGSEGLYATKAELTAEEEAREEADATLENSIAAEVTRATAAEATKVDKEITSAEGKALIFNEADGGGAKFEHVSGLNSFVGVNNGAEDEEGLAAQIYAVDATESGHNLGAKLDVTVGGMYYTRGAASGSRPSSRDVPANELAVKRDITEAVATETTARQAADAALQSGKLDIMPGDTHTAGNPYNLPYYFRTSADANKVTVTAETVTLDGNKTYGTYSMDVNAATASVAGLMAAADKTKLDDIGSLTEAEIRDICK